VVGVVLGVNEAATTAEHLSKRLTKTEETSRKLRRLALPAGICGLLWKTVVLPQTHYGCEVRDVRLEYLKRLRSAGRAVVESKSPLCLNGWRAPEVLSGWPLGEMAQLDMRRRQLRWLVVVANTPGLMGDVHQAAATVRADGEYVEPTVALRATVSWAGWTMRRNRACLRTAAWPAVAAEDAYEGEIRMLPEDSFLLPNAGFTDGSVGRSGGVAAVQPDTGLELPARVLSPRSCTANLWRWASG